MNPWLTAASRILWLGVALLVILWLVSLWPKGGVIWP